MGGELAVESLNLQRTLQIFVNPCVGAVSFRFLAVIAFVNHATLFFKVVVISITALPFTTRARVRQIGTYCMSRRAINYSESSFLAAAAAGEERQ